jgi:hypothetical protein
LHHVEVGEDIDVNDLFDGEVRVVIADKLVEVGSVVEDLEDADVLIWQAVSVGFSQGSHQKPLEVRGVMRQQSTVNMKLFSIQTISDRNRDHLEVVTVFVRPERTNGLVTRDLPGRLGMGVVARSAIVSGQLFDLRRCIA